MDPFKTDEFTKKEKMLVDELKLNCKNDGKEINPELSAPIFHKLGLLYLCRSKICSAIEIMICLIRCAVLLNAALVRDDNDTNNIKQDLKQLYHRLLKAAEAQQKDVDLWKITEKVKQSFEELRSYVNKELLKIPKVEVQESEEQMIEQEQNKINAIESLQNRITADYTKIMAMLANTCEQIVGKPPCKFAIIGMGSLARKEITPYSDFEHVIVLDFKSDSKNEKTLNYFRWYSVIFQIVLINMGETIIPSILNKTNSMCGSWFYDDVTKSGVSFDGTFQWACKYPLGRQQLTKSKPWKTELIKSVPGMLKYLRCAESLKNGYHLGDILTKVCYVYGDQSLYNEFKSGVNNILTEQDKNLKTEVLIQIKDDLENFAIRSVLLKIADEGKCHVKKDVYRVTSLFIAALGRLNNITALSCFDIIRQLATENVISKNAMHNQMYAIAIACEIRLRWYMVNKRQKDEINEKHAPSTFLEIVGEASAISYFQIAYALQCDISKQFDLKKGHFYSHPDLLNLSIHTNFQNSTQIKNFVREFKASTKEQRLLDFDSCLVMLKLQQAKFTHIQSVFEINTQKNKKHCLAVSKRLEKI